MFDIFRKLAVLTMIVLFFAGCGASSSVNGDFDPVETMELDGEYESNVSVEIGEIFALDMFIPLSKGYTIIGASFDPSMFKLEHYLEYDDDGTPRARYLFMVLADGASDILIKMEPLSGGDVVVYKQIGVMVGGDRGLF